MNDLFIMGRIVLVGELLPTSDKWKRIIDSSGGETLIVPKTSVNKNVKNYLSTIDGEESKRLAILPDGMKRNPLVTLLLQHHFSCVPSRFVILLLLLIEVNGIVVGLFK